MGLKDIILKLFRSVQNALEVISEKIGIKESAKRVFVHLMIYLTCLTLLTLTYFTFYLIFIPRVYQATELNFQRTDEGYRSRILNYDHSFPICKNKHIIDKSETDLEKVFKKICIDPLNTFDHGLVFEPEIYTIKLLLEAPNNDLLDQISILPVGVEFINKKNEVIENEALGNVELKRPGPIKKMINFILNSIGFSSGNREISVTLSDKFANDYFELIVMNLHIPESKILLGNARIEFKVILTGLRRIMYEWFWIFSFITIISSSFFSYLFLTFGVKIVDSILDYMDNKNETKSRSQNLGLNMRDRDYNTRKNNASKLD